jgi:hypothetical protein
MPDQNPAFGGGLTETLLHPLVLAALLIAIPLMLLLPRRYVVVPFFVCIFLVPTGQEVYVSGAHLLVCRILVLAGWVRLIGMKIRHKRRLFAGGFNSLDQAFVLCMLCQAVCVVVLYMQAAALTNQFGFLIDFVGAYLLLRGLIRDREDVHLAVKCLAFVGLFLGACLVYEQLAVKNAFGFLGGVRLTPEIREGKIRAQGPFEHPLLAGTFGATLLPLFLLLWKSGKARTMAVIGMIGSTTMTIASQSSTPLLGYVAGVLGICLWPLRKQMRVVRWGLVLGILALAVVMKAPVWFVIAHIDLTGGSSGYHRAELVDQFIRHFSDWWLIGTKSAADWGFDMWDAQNQYVAVGETGGLAAFILFITMIVRVYSRLGRARRSVEGSQSREWLVWLLGAAFFAHLVSFIGVNYFDQSKVGLLALLAMISAAAVPMRRTKRLPEVAPDIVLDDSAATASQPSEALA